MKTVSVDEEFEYQHYLLTLQIARNYYMHAYVIAEDKQQTYAVLDRMIEHANKMGPSKMRLPAAMITILDSGVDVVRDIVASTSDEAKRQLEKSTRSHMTIFALEANHPDNARLLELH